jgi:hypothetical protein
VTLMAKRGRPPNDDVEDDVRAAIVKLTVESQPHEKLDDRVKAAGEEFRKQAKHPGWRDLLKMDSPRSIYALLKRFRVRSEK